MKTTPIEIGLPILSILLGGHICYAIGTKEEKEIFHDFSISLIAYFLLLVVTSPFYFLW